MYALHCNSEGSCFVAIHMVATIVVVIVVVVVVVASYYVDLYICMGVWSS